MERRYKDGMVMEGKTAAKLKEYATFAAIITGVYIGFRFLSPLASPFLFAFAFVALLHPMLEKVQNKYHIKKGILAASILLLFCVTAGMGIWCLVIFMIQKLGDLFAQIDLFEEKFLYLSEAAAMEWKKSSAWTGRRLKTLLWKEWMYLLKISRCR